MNQAKSTASNKIIGDIEAEAPRYSQEAIQQETGQVQEATQDRLLRDLDSALSPNTREAPIGKVSSDYITKKAASQSAEADRGARLARLFAAIDAPNQARLKQSLDAADARARRAAISSGANAFVGNIGTDLQRIEPDTALTTAGGVLSGAGQAYSAYDTNERLKKAMSPQIFGQS
jgi:hypothetical protein